MTIKYYFHGTTKDKAQEVLKSGFSYQEGRATLTDNPQYAMHYGDFQVLLIFDTARVLIKPAIDSDIQVDEQSQTITGWPNRYKREQYGIYDDGDSLEPEKIAGCIVLNDSLRKILDGFDDSIKSGAIDERGIESFKKEVTEVLDDSDWSKSLSAENAVLAESITDGMIRNVLLHEIRQNYFSRLILDGWKIVNNGDHEVKVKSADELAKSNKSISKIIDELFVPAEIKEEFNNLAKE